MRKNQKDESFFDVTVIRAPNGGEVSVSGERGDEKSNKEGGKLKAS